MQLSNDIQVVERRDDVRIIISLPGRYVLANKRNARGERREFACRVINISSYGLAVAAPVVGTMGERVIAHIDQFGRFEGPIVRVLNGGFVMEITVSEEERTKLTNKIRWFEKQKNHDVHDGRRHERIVPKKAHSTLTLSDGAAMGCLVIDVSVSGAAVSADVVPEIGTVLAVGKAVGRVVRHFGEGFAVEFITIHDDLNVIEELVMRPNFE
jgi:hypothetical protein